MLVTSDAQERIPKKRALARAAADLEEINGLVTEADSELEQQLFSAAKAYQDRVRSLSKRRDVVLQRYLSP